MRSTIILGTLCALLAYTAPASAAPAWCKGGDEKPRYDMESVFTNADADDALLELVAASCYPESDLANQTAQVAKVRDAWSKKLGLVEADWGDVSEWAHLPRHLRGDPKIMVKDRGAALGTLSPIEQYSLLYMTIIGDTDGAYLADAIGDRLSQTGRLGWVNACLEQAGDDPAVAWATCATDAAALDLAKIGAEVRGDTKQTAADRMTVRLVAYETLTKKIPKYQADAKALRAKDPSYERMFQIAETSFKDWSKTDAKLVSLMNDLDDARLSGSRKASAGCIEKTWAAWQATVPSLSAKQLGEIHSEPGNEFVTQFVWMFVQQPNGYLASLALNQCADLEEKEDALTGVIGHALVRWPGFRGPRTGAITKILTADLKLDKRGAEIDYPDVKRPFIKGDANIGTLGLGGIDAIKIEGERATVTFKKEKVTQTRCVRGHSTSKMRAINADGSILYWYQCDQEITETIEVAPSPPLKTHARYVAGMKKGMSVRIIDGVAVVAYPKGKTVPVVALGVEVK